MKNTESEKELNAKLQAIKQKNLEQGLTEINAILEKRGLELITQVPIHIEGKLIGVSIRSKQ